MDSTQQAIIPFPAEGNRFIYQTNFGSALAAGAPLDTPYKGYPVEEDLTNIPGLVDQILLHSPKDYGAGESCVFPSTEDYPGQFDFNLEFEPSGTAKSVTYTVRSGTRGDRQL